MVDVCEFTQWTGGPGRYKITFKDKAQEIIPSLVVDHSIRCFWSVGSEVHWLYR